MCSEGWAELLALAWVEASPLPLQSEKKTWKYFVLDLKTRMDFSFIAASVASGANPALMTVQTQALATALSTSINGALGAGATISPNGDFLANLGAALGGKNKQLIICHCINDHRCYQYRSRRTRNCQGRFGLRAAWCRLWNSLRYSPCRFSAYRISTNRLTWQICLFTGNGVILTVIESTANLVAALGAGAGALVGSVGPVPVAVNVTLSAEAVAALEAWVSATFWKDPIRPNLGSFFSLILKIMLFQFHRSCRYFSWQHCNDDHSDSSSCFGSPRCIQWCFCSSPHSSRWVSNH